MSKNRPPTYELRKQGGTTGVGGAWSDEVGEIGEGDALGHVGGAAAGTLGSAKKSCEKPCFFL